MWPKDAEGNLIKSDVDYVDTWKAMEECVKLGLTKSIGVSNFNSEQIKRVLDAATIKPVVNQVSENQSISDQASLYFVPSYIKWKTESGLNICKQEITKLITQSFRSSYSPNFHLFFHLCIYIP